VKVSVLYSFCHNLELEAVSDYKMLEPSIRIHGVILKKLEFPLLRQ
jgi:hypothetical protein